MKAQLKPGPHYLRETLTILRILAVRVEVSVDQRPDGFTWIGKLLNKPEPSAAYGQLRSVGLNVGIKWRMYFEEILPKFKRRKK